MLSNIVTENWLGKPFFTFRYGLRLATPDLPVGLCSRRSSFDEICVASHQKPGLKLGVAQKAAISLLSIGK
ncbi:MAG: hypothetical protein K8F91_00600, partial [Candidatus Obscuribacterales bacterium]|nr:hypothetical protein [Candidatus Obscuribacterales bacterium]